MGSSHLLMQTGYFTCDGIKEEDLLEITCLQSLRMLERAAGSDEAAVAMNDAFMEGIGTLICCIALIGTWECKEQWGLHEEDGKTVNQATEGKGQGYNRANDRQGAVLMPWPLGQVTSTSWATT